MSADLEFQSTSLYHALYRRIIELAATHWPVAPAFRPPHTAFSILSYRASDERETHVVLILYGPNNECVVMMAARHQREEGAMREMLAFLERQFVEAYSGNAERCMM